MIKHIILSLFLLLSFPLKAQSLLSQEEIISWKVKDYMNQVLNIYNKEKQTNITLSLITTSDPLEKSFLEDTTKKKNFEDNFFSLIFFKKILIQEKLEPTCLLIVSNKNWTDMMDSYMYYFKTEDNLTEYLALHEISHCISNLENNSYKHLQEEAFADIFASIMLIKMNKIENIKNIIEITQMSSDEQHKTFEYLQTILKNPNKYKNLNSISEIVEASQNLIENNLKITDSLYSKTKTNKKAPKT